VAILLATKNGARFLPEQLSSYLEQTHKNWSLHVSDDGSSDETVEIITGFSSRIANQTTLRDGPRAGCHRNFFLLLRDNRVDADYFAFSDQDDIWHPEKLERALSFMQNVRDDQPAVYCSRTELIDGAGQHSGFSRNLKKAPSFQNALVENVAVGNTMVFNRAARALLARLTDQNIVIHDWSTYVFVSAVGGTILYDRTPLVRYRQHENNLIVAKSSFRARVRRIGKGQWQAWTAAHLEGLAALSTDITAENRSTLKSFIQMREADGLLQRCWYLLKSGVYRQTLLGQIGLLLAAAFRKV
jgi:glycosyltransferase involved in cell wall biosynthesis